MISKRDYQISDIYNFEESVDDILPDIPTDRIEWEYACRPKIKGVPNRLKYLPMLLEAVLDKHPWKQYLWGRQWGKTTQFASELAYGASTNHDYDQTYVNFELEAVKTFSDNKFRKDVFSVYPLSEYIEGVSKYGSMSKVTLKTNSTIDMITALHKWIHAQGKSNQKMIVDEGNDIEWEGFQNARETQADTMGDFMVGGIGGYVDTQYERLWKTTNQMTWKFRHGEDYKGYENMSWRRELERRCFDEHGLVYDDNLSDVMDGKWVPQAPKNFSRHGYWLPQIYNPRIPLTEADAIELYKVSPEFSIEWKLKDPDYTNSEFRRNVMAEFVEGDVKPITTKMMLALFDKTVGLTKAADVDHAAGRVYIGIDWGGGGKTIVWIWQCLDDKAPIFKLLWAERMETSDVEEQKNFCINLIDAYEASQIVVDAGGGTRQVQALQTRYGTRCIRNSYHARPEKPLPTREEAKKQRKELRYVIDRTFSIDRVIDLISHPYVQGDFKSNRVILPGKNQEDLKWAVKQFVALESETAKLKSTGQTYIRYIHKDSEPDDALQACNYAYIAWDLGRSKGGEIIGGGLGEEADFDNAFGNY